MVWVVLIGVVVLVIAISSASKKSQVSIHNQTQVLSNSGRSTQVRKTNGALSWSITPTQMGLMNNSFVLSAADGPAYNIRFGAEMLGGGKLYLNDRVVASGSPFKMKESLPYSFEHDGDVYNGAVVVSSGMSGYKLSIYLEDQFLGEFSGKS